MKKTIFLITILLLPLLLIAQQQTTTIKVSARSVLIDSSPEFKATVALSSSYSSLPAEMTTLEILKKKYKSALKANDISWSNLKKDSNGFGYESMGYGKDGIIYEYRTKSVEKMKKFLKTKSLGMQMINYSSIITIDEEEAAKLSETALANAKARAAIIATAMGKELGDIKEIEDLNNRYGEEIESSIYYDRPIGEYFYMINVIFSVK
ncbi:SIMPL domain-containing protein [Winogradskyella psychrotolerans]|uniref:SIMPL domain-containing protein n=1 Tax=Winogradskyella psychrotolerans TaxID=1344585 RepID=UPI001C06F695|nr:SIMPL domain-containing protein [Winogradskyella psychrotolerans]MBU2926701.1 SIMPL domain-containing protein [Winogradskyella psychrotolerans]